MSDADISVGIAPNEASFNATNALFEKIERNAMVLSGRLDEINGKLALMGKGAGMGTTSGASSSASDSVKESTAQMARLGEETDNVKRKLGANIVATDTWTNTLDRSITMMGKAGKMNENMMQAAHMLGELDTERQGINKGLGFDNIKDDITLLKKLRMDLSADLEMMLSKDSITDKDWGKIRNRISMLKELDAQQKEMSKTGKQEVYSDAWEDDTGIKKTVASVTDLNTVTKSLDGQIGSIAAKGGLGQALGTADESDLNRMERTRELLDRQKRAFEEIRRMSTDPVASKFVMPGDLDEGNAMKAVDNLERIRQEMKYNSGTTKAYANDLDMLKDRVSQLNNAERKIMSAGGEMGIGSKQQLAQIRSVRGEITDIVHAHEELGRLSQDPKKGRFVSEQAKNDLWNSRENLKAVNSQLREMNELTSFDKFGIRMSGIAATLFVFQQATAWMRGIVSIITSLEDAMIDFKMTTRSTTAELEILKETALKIEKTGIQSAADALKELKGYKDIGLSASEAAIVVMENNKTQVEAAADTLGGAIDKLTGNLKGLIHAKIIANELRAWVNIPNDIFAIIELANEVSGNQKKTPAASKQQPETVTPGHFKIDASVQIAADNVDRHMQSRHQEFISLYDTELKRRIATMGKDYSGGTQAAILQANDMKKIAEHIDKKAKSLGAMTNIADKVLAQANEAFKDVKNQLSAEHDIAMLPDTFARPFETQLIQLSLNHKDGIAKYKQLGKTKEEYLERETKEIAEIHKNAIRAYQRITDQYDIDMLPDEYGSDFEASLIRLKTSHEARIEDLKKANKTTEEIQALYDTMAAKLSEKKEKQDTQLRLGFQYDMIGKGDMEGAYAHARAAFEATLKERWQEMSNLGMSDSQKRAWYNKQVDNLKKQYGHEKSQYDGMKASFASLPAAWGTEYSMGENLVVNSLNSINDTFINLATSSETNSKRVLNAFTDMVRGILNEFAKMQMQSLIMRMFSVAATKGVSAPGATDNLMSVDLETGQSYANIANAGGGTLYEPIVGIGLDSGKTYSFAENEPEDVVPQSKKRTTKAGASPVLNLSLNISAIDTQTGSQFIKRNAQSIVASLINEMKHSPQTAHFVRRG